MGRAASRVISAITIIGVVLAASPGKGVSAATFCTAAERGRGPKLSLLTPFRCDTTAPVQPRPACEFCQQLHNQVRRSCSIAQDDYSPYADSLFSRHPLGARFGPEIRHRLMAATLAQDQSAAYEITEPLRVSSDPAERYVGNVAAAYAAIRGGRPDRTVLLKTLLNALSADRAASGLPEADEPYLRALAALDDKRPADADVALEEALRLEPKFFSALALSTRLQLLATVSASQGDHKNCEAQFRLLMVRMQRIMELSPCLTLAAHLETFLSRALVDPFEQPAFLVVQVYFGLVSHRFGFARGAANKFENSRAVCRSRVSDELQNWMSTALEAQRL